MKYVCIEEFALDRVDDDGFFTGDVLIVAKGSVWDRAEGPFRLVGAADTVRLEGDNYQWLEITKEHLDMYFEERS